MRLLGAGPALGWWPAAGARGHLEHGALAHVAAALEDGGERALVAENKGGALQVDARHGHAQQLHKMVHPQQPAPAKRLEPTLPPNKPNSETAGLAHMNRVRKE